MIRNNTIVIGLTGSMAAGKSTAAARLRELGAVVIDADQASRRVVEKGQPALAALAARFGSGILDGEGKLDRKAMAALAFTDPAALAALNGILHPAIRTEMERELDGPGKQEPGWRCWMCPCSLSAVTMGCAGKAGW